MQTYSHFLLTALLNDGLKARGAPVHTRGLLLGSFMPDIPLGLLTLGFVIRRYRAGVPRAADPICGPHFNQLYFHHPLWQAGHALFHAPLLIGLMAWLGWQQRRGWGRALFWFALACGFHSLIDTLTHHDDGPLLLFPFDWNYRFAAPLSYWDAQHGGQQFALGERLLALALGLYFVVKWLTGRKGFKGK